MSSNYRTAVASELSLFGYGSVQDKKGKDEGKKHRAKLSIRKWTLTNASQVRSCLRGTSKYTHTSSK